MFNAARHSLRRAVSRAAVAPATGTFSRGAFYPGEYAVGARTAPSAVAQVAASRFERGITASSHASSDETPPATGEKGLSQVLGEELEHERTTYTPSDVVAKGPPTPFEIIESDGDCEITLVRSFGQDEEIAVTFNATEDPYEDEYEEMVVDDEEEDEDVTIHFTVSVSRGDGHEGLEFSCATDGETVEVRNVRYEQLNMSSDDTDDLDDDESYFSSYPGPNYDELDESVQEEFHKYLEVRGVDSDLANYIAEVHVDKEQREYTRWLENVSNFVK